MTSKKLYEIAATLFVLINRKLPNGEIVVDLGDRRKIRLAFKIEEPKLFICHDSAEIGDLAEMKEG